MKHEPHLTGTEAVDAFEAKWALSWCPSCEEQMPCADDGVCRGCDTVIDDSKAAAFEEAQIEEAFAEDRWRPRITVGLGTGSYGWSNQS